MCRAILILVGLFSTIGLSPAHADVIVSPVSVLNPPATSWSFYKTIDQSGLSTGYGSGVTDFDAYIALNPTHYGNNTTEGYTDSEPVVNIDYDLGETLTIGRMALWFSRFPLTANPKEIQVLTSATSDFSAPFDAGTFFPNDGRISVSASAAPVQVFNLNDSLARYVRVSVQSKFGTFGVFYSEIAFASVTAVPEPASLALLMAPTISGLAFAMRKSRRKPSVA